MILAPSDAASFPSLGENNDPRLSTFSSWAMSFRKPSFPMAWAGLNGGNGKINMEGGGFLELWPR